MPSFNTLRYVNGYYKSRSGGAPPAAEVVELESTNASQDAYIVKYTPDGVASWAARIGGSGSDAGYSIAADSSGNTYVAGAMLSRTYLYNADGTTFPAIFPNTATADSNAFLIKYNSSGVVQWAARIGTSGAQTTAWAVTVDPSGNPIFTGVGGSGVTMDIFNANGTLFGTLANSGGTDVFIVKYNTNGAAQWRARIASTGNDIGYAIATDSAGSVFVAGEGGTGATITSFSGSGTAFGNVLGNAGSNDAFLVKYNSSGTVQWAARVASTGGDTGFGLATDSAGSVYFTGRNGASATAFNANTTAFGTTIPSSGGGDAFIVKYNGSGTVQWVTRIASTGLDTGFGIATDTSGDFYVIGQSGINATVTAFSSNGTAFGTTLASLGQQDVFLVKYNTSGIVQWVTRLGTIGTDFGYSVATDSSNNVYVTGQSGPAPLTVYNSSGFVFGTLSNSTSSLDGFLVKYNSSGTAQWARKLSSIYNDIGRGVAIDSGGGVVTTGTYSGANYSLYGQALSLFSSQPLGAPVVKYNTNGAPQWAARISPSAVVALDANGIAKDTTGNIYVVGDSGINATVTAFSSNGVAFGTTLPNSGFNDAFIVKYDSSGIVQWVARIASNSTDRAYSVTTDSGGNLIVTGNYSAVATAFNSDGTAFSPTLTNSGSSDVFVVKYDPDGFVLWVARIASSAADSGWRITTDTSNAIYVTGNGGTGVAITSFSSNGTSFSPTLANAGGTDAFLVKYNSAGIVQWNARIASTAADAGRGIVTDSAENVYVAGNAGTAITTAFNANGTAFGTTLPAAAGGTCFLVKYNSTGSVQWITRAIGASAFAVCTDSSNNVFFGGITGGTATVYNSTDTVFGTVSSIGGNDAWVAKYNSAGIAQWIVQVGSSANEVTGNIATDSAGNVYLAGVFGPATSLTAPALTIYDAAGTIFASAYGSFGLVKYGTDGRPNWFQAIAGAGINDLAVTAVGDVYITGGSGTFRVFGSDFTRYAGLNSVGGGQDAFIVKQSQSGVPQWGATLSSSGADTGFGVVTDTGGNVIVFGQGGAGVVTTAYNANGTAFSRTIPVAGAQSEAILAKYNSSGSVQWVARVSTNQIDIGNSVATDSSGNIYVTGQGGAGAVITAFNSDGTAFATTLANAGGNDVFVVKYNPSGFVQWVARIASTGNDIGFAIATDSAGNVVVAGQGGNAVITAFSSNGNAFGTTLANDGLGDGFLIEYDTNGIVQWVARVGSTQADIVYGVTVDATSGQIYITGAAGTGVTLTAYNANTSAFGTTLASLGGADIFLVAYSSAGNVQWVARMGGGAIDNGRAVTTDSSGNVYVTGLFTGGFQPYSSNGAAFGTAYSGSTGTEAFVVKYNSSGIVQWWARVFGPGGDVGFAVATDSAGDVYVAGQVTDRFAAYNADGTFFGGGFASTLVASGSGLYSFIIKYSPSGGVLWISPSRAGGTAAIRGMDIDSANNIYTTGLFTSSTLVPQTSATFVPTFVDSCALWLDGADESSVTLVSGVVSQWNDKSGNARNATQATAGNRPSWTNSAIVISSINRWLDMTNAFAMVSATNRYHIFVVEKRASNAATHYMIGFGGTTANNGIAFGYQNNTTFNFTSASIADTQYTVPAWQSTDPIRIWGGEYNGTTRDLYLNGTLVTSTAYTQNVAGWTTARIGYLAYLSINTTYLGDIYEILFYSRALTTTDRQLIEGYLANKWGLAGSLPTGHPYKTISP